MAANPFTTRFEGPAPEVEVTRDMLRRGVWGAPVLVGICAAIWGGAGALSSLFAIGLVMGCTRPAVLDSDAPPDQRIVRTDSLAALWSFYKFHYLENGRVVIRFDGGNRALRHSA